MQSTTALTAKWNADRSGLLLIPTAAVSDPARDRALVFYSKTLSSLSGETRGIEDKAGVSLAVWKAVEGPATRPEVQRNVAERTLLFGPDEPTWGTAAFALENVLYAYACDSKEPGKVGRMCKLARVPLDRALDRTSWRFYAGGNWSENWRDASGVMDNNWSSFTVHWNKYVGKFISVSTRTLDHRILLRAADRPEGPWSQPVVEVEGLGASVGHQFSGVWGAVGHPELSSEDGRVEYITYFRAGTLGDEMRMLRIEFAR